MAHTTYHRRALSFSSQSFKQHVCRQIFLSKIQQSKRDSFWKQFRFEKKKKKKEKKLDQLTRYHRVYAFLVALSPPITFLSGLFSLLVRYFWDGKMRSDRERYIDRQKEKVKYLSELPRSTPPPPFDLSTTTHTPSLTSDIKRSR